MKTLSKEAEQRIISAVKQAVSLVDAGDHTPDAAIEKMARDNAWGPDMVRFVSHAFNTGRQLAHREGHDNALDKYAAHDLADAEAIIGNIWSSNKVAQVLDRGTPSIVASSVLQPGWLGLRKAAEDRQRLYTPIEKVAVAATVEQRPSVTATINKHKNLKTAAEEARTQTGMSYDRLVSAMGQLADYFTKLAHDRLPFADVEFAAVTYHKEAGQNLMDWVYNRNRMKEVRHGQQKRASAALEVNVAVAPWSLIQRAVDCARDIQEKRAAEGTAFDLLEKHAAADLLPLVAAPVLAKQAEYSLLPVEPGPVAYDPSALRTFLPHTIKPAEKAAASPLPVAEEPWSIFKEAGPMSAAAVGAGTKDLLERALGGSDSTQQQYTALEDPGHEAQLRQIRTQAMLTDLMNDEVIGAHDPARVLSAFNEISEMAPRTAGQALPMRSLLRRHLEGNLEPHEANQVTDIESGIKNTYNPVPEAYVPGAAKPPAAKSPKMALDLNLIPDEAILLA